MDDWVRAFHQHHQTRLAVVPPELQMVVEVTSGFEEPHPALLIPPFVQSDLAQSLAFGFFRGAADR